MVNKQQMWVKKVVHTTEEQGSSFDFITYAAHTGHGVKVMLKWD